MPGILWAVPIEPVAVQPLYPNTQKQHVTLAYGCDKSEIENLIGLPATIAITANCWNAEIQSLKVVLPNWVPCKNNYPHITISWVDDSAPVRSNLMLEAEHHEDPMDAVVHCMIEWIEWTEPVNPRKWRDRPIQQCEYVWKRDGNGHKKGDRCTATTRSATGFCRKHQP